MAKDRRSASTIEVDVTFRLASPCVIHWGDTDRE